MKRFTSLAAQTCQRFLYEIGFVFIDDIFVTSNNEDDRCEYLKILFDQLNRYV